MKRLRVLVVVAALGFGCMAPVMTQAQVEPPGWSWGVLAERWLGWANGLWTAVAGSETGEPAEEDSGGGTPVEFEGAQGTTDPPPSTNDSYPGLDPNG